MELKNENSRVQTILNKSYQKSSTRDKKRAIPDIKSIGLNAAAKLLINILKLPMIFLFIFSSLFFSFGIIISLVFDLFHTIKK